MRAVDDIWITAAEIRYRAMGMAVLYRPATGDARLVTRAARNGLSRYNVSKHPDPEGLTLTTFPEASDAAKAWLEENKSAIREIDAAKLEWVPFA